MRSVVWYVGAVVIAGVGSVYGCSSPSDHPPVLGGTTGLDSGLSSGSSGGAGGSSSGGSSGSSSGGVNCKSDNGCNMLQVCGPQIDLTNRSGSFPTPAGGTVVPGTYVLTSIDYYAPMTAWFRQTIVLSLPDGGTAMDASTDGGTAMDASTDATASDGPDEAGDDGGSLPDASLPETGPSGQTFQLEMVSDSDTETVTSLNGSLTVSGTLLSISYTCQPATAQYNAGYSAGAATLDIFAQPLIFHYSKR